MYEDALRLQQKGAVHDAELKFTELLEQPLIAELRVCPQEIFLDLMLAIVLAWPTQYSRQLRLECVSGRTCRMTQAVCTAASSTRRRT